jgi:hypothetical protein
MKWLVDVLCDMPIKSFLVVAPADWGQDRVAKALADMGIDAVIKPYDAHDGVQSPCGLVKVLYLPDWRVDTQRV